MRQGAVRQEQETNGNVGQGVADDEEDASRVEKCAGDCGGGGPAVRIQQALPDTGMPVQVARAEGRGRGRARLPAREGADREEREELQSSATQEEAETGREEGKVRHGSVRPRSQPRGPLQVQGVGEQLDRHGVLGRGLDRHVGPTGSQTGTRAA